jgi:hypothetical protein
MSPKSFNAKRMKITKTPFGRAPGPLKMALAPASLKEELLRRSRVFL